MEWSMLIQSPTDWGILFLSALIIGMSKTGIQGLSLISVPLLALAFGAKPSTGLILPILCIADLIAVLYYRRIAEWKYVFKLLPAALVGFILALLVDKVIPPAAFKHLMGGCLAIVLLVMFWSEWKGKENKLSSCWWYGPFFGLLGGFTTMIGNAAGPVMAIYLLSVKMPKYSFVGTNAWFFLVINYYDRENEMYAVEKRNVHLCWGGRHGWRQNEMCIFSEFFGVEAGRCRVYHGMINPRLNGNQTRVNC